MVKLKILKEVEGCSRLNHGFRRESSSLFRVLVGKIPQKLSVGYRGQVVSQRTIFSIQNNPDVLENMQAWEEASQMQSEVLTGIKHKRKCTRCVSRIRWPRRNTVPPNHSGIKLGNPQHKRSCNLHWMQKATKLSRDISTMIRLRKASFQLLNRWSSNKWKADVLHDLLLWSSISLDSQVSAW